MSKYHVEQRPDGRVRVSLTALGRAREFGGGVVAALPWAVFGLAAIFLPDYLGNYRNKAQVLPIFIGMLIAMFVGICVASGLRRSFGTRFWEFDAEDGVVRCASRTIFGRPVVSRELPLSAALQLNGAPGTVELLFAGGANIVLASAWSGQEELRSIRRIVAEHCPAVSVP